MILRPPAPPIDHVEPPPPSPRGGADGASAWLLRHARVADPFAETAYGDRDVPLSAAGEARTTELGDDFRTAGLKLVVASPLERARRLGESIATASGAELRVDERLRELHRGAWQGLSREEYSERWRAEAGAFWRDPLTWRGHGGETEEELRERTWPVFAAALATGGTVAFATHRNVIRAIVATALGISVGRSYALITDPGRGVLLRSDPGGWVLVRSNAARP